MLILESILAPFIPLAFVIIGAVVGCTHIEPNPMWQGQELPNCPLNRPKGIWVSGADKSLDLASEAAKQTLTGEYGYTGSIPPKVLGHCWRRDGQQVEAVVGLTEEAIYRYQEGLERQVAKLPNLPFKRTLRLAVQVRSWKEALGFFAHHGIGVSAIRLDSRLPQLFVQGDTPNLVRQHLGNLGFPLVGAKAEATVIVATTLTTVTIPAAEDSRLRYSRCEGTLTFKDQSGRILLTTSTSTKGGGLDHNQATDRATKAAETELVDAIGKGEESWSH